MSFFASIKSFFVGAEQTIDDIIADVVSGVKVADKVLYATFEKVVAATPAIAANLQAIESMVLQIESATPGATQNAIVTKAILEANVAVDALNAMAEKANAGGSVASSLVSGYVAGQQAQAAVSTAKAAVASVTPAKAA